MKIELWAKKLQGGHVLIGTQEVPDNFGNEYRMPVKNPINVVNIMNANEFATTQNSPINSYRSFRYMPSPDERAFKFTRRYLEV